MADRILIPDTELEVFPVGLGTVKAGLSWDGADADRIFDAYLDIGGNLIDTAHVYSDWVRPEKARSERVIGDWLERSGKRNQVVLVTKGGHPDMLAEVPDLHKSRMTKADMTEDLNGSLKQFRTDHVDLYFYHRDDENQSVAELIEVMESFRKEGKIRYYGCSNWTTKRMAEADAYCREHGYRGFIANQALFNLGSRYMKPMEDDTLAVMDQEMYAYHQNNPRNIAMPYMGVASGFFHAYAARGEEAVKNRPYCTPQNLKLAKRVVKLTEKYNVTVSQAVLGFFKVQDFKCLPLYGPRDAEEIKDAAGMIEIPFTKEDFCLND